MARPTKLAQSIAEAIGEPPSRVQGWIERGLGPATSDVDAAEHFHHLAPLLGTGRDDDVAALKMAAGGYPCRCLRDVLARLAHQGAEQVTDADELIEHFMADETVADLRDVMTTQARRLRPPVEWTAPQDVPEAALDEAAVADVTVRAAALPIAGLLTGELVEPFDTVELDRLGGWEQLDMPALPFDNEGAGLSLMALRLAQEAARTSDPWIAAAPPAELARGVGAARALAESLVVLHPGAGAWADEHRWRRIGWLAPIAVPVLTAALALFDRSAGVEVSPALRRYMDAIESGRRYLPGPDEARSDEQT